MYCLLPCVAWASTSSLCRLPQRLHVKCARALDVPQQRFTRHSRHPRILRRYHALHTARVKNSHSHVLHITTEFEVVSDKNFFRFFGVAGAKTPQPISSVGHTPFDAVQIMWLYTFILAFYFLCIGSLFHFITSDSQHREEKKEEEGKGEK